MRALQLLEEMQIASSYLSFPTFPTPSHSGTLVEVCGDLAEPTRNGPSWTDPRSPLANREGPLCNSRGTEMES